MKLASVWDFTTERPAIGVVQGDRMLILNRVAENAGMTRFPLFMSGLLRMGQDGRELVDSLLDRILKDEDPTLFEPLKTIELFAPVDNPGKIICTGLNYRDHCEEQGVPIPDFPVSFAKYVTSILAPGEGITWPEGATSQVDYEAELAVVIGEEIVDATPEQAMDYVFGYTIINDVSARDVQFTEKQWVRSKSFDTFCPMGPYLVTKDEINDPHNLAIRTRLNGDVMQESNTREMVFKIPELIARFSQGCTLMPGDIISTGTPGGVGVFRKPQVFLNTGDVVEIEIEGIGTLRNEVDGPS